FYTICSPVHFVLAKLIFNSLLMFVMTACSLILFIALIGNPIVKLFPFFGIAFLGGFSLSIVFTFLAAIAAKAKQNAAIMAVLGFPLIVPQLMLLMKLSNAAFNLNLIIQSNEILLLIALDLLVGLLSVILFPFLWKD
ncbi:MAG TPA: cytochrome C biogenesis protein, partial [Niabella sp.]|nr:cytochrome C biogenesis protein [Niabella sp.]